MNLLAIIDARHTDAPEGPATVVAGLTLVERAARLVAICGATEVVVRCAQSTDQTALGEFSETDVPVRIVDDDSPVSIGPHPDAVLVLDAGVVFDRSRIERAIEMIEEAGPDTCLRDQASHLAVCRGPGSEKLRDLIADPRAVLEDASESITAGWSLRIDSEQAVEHATDHLFESCRKPVDGIVARHLNRHISLFISRRLASTDVKPNHITVVHFLLGVAAALAAGFGHYTGFLLAGILYQTNSVVDGVDGELARVRYEFSFLGEWLDTISDDFADLFMFVGLGIGAWRTMPGAPGSLGVEIWLTLGLVAAIGKIATMGVYYRWLLAAGSGDLQAFQWSFDEPENTSDGVVARFLSFARYFFRKDFIVFAAMILGIAGVLPHLLFVVAPGTVIIATSVVVQQLQKRNAAG